ncbi:MAG TPA: hypothetical protein VGM01_12460, partial [Ktedonobacteraceae bacterium]
MRNENATLLLSQPISEIAIDQVDQRYLTRVQWYLEHELQCKITPLAGRDGHLIVFPAGTVEETYEGQSTQWTHKTLIRFPGGSTLQKYVASPLNPTQRAQTMLAFPNSILDG